MERMIVKLAFFAIFSYISSDFYILGTNTYKNKRVSLFLGVLLSHMILLFPGYESFELLCDVLQIVLEFVFIVALTEGKIIRKIVLYMIFNVFSIIGIVVGYGFYGVVNINAENVKISYVVVYYLVYVIVIELLCILFLRIEKKNKGYFYSLLGIEISVIIGIATLFILYATGICVFDKEGDINGYVICLLLGFVILALIFIKDFNRFVIQLENKKIKEHVELQYCKNMDKLGERLKIKEELYENRINSLKGEIDGIYRYIGENHKLLDNLIEAKKRKAEEKGLIIKLEKDIHKNTDMSMEDQIGIIANLFDNAIRASMLCREEKITMECKAQEEKECDITMRIKIRENEFVMYIENGYTGELDYRQNSFYSTKKSDGGHGLGIENVRNILAKYGKSADIKTDNKRFIVDIR